MSRITVLISGSGSNLQALIDAQRDGKLGSGEIVSVISSSKNAYGLERAQQVNIPTKIHSLYKYTKSIDKQDKNARAHARVQFEKDLAKVVLEDKPDLVVCAGWLLILGPTFLANVGKTRIINLHPALPGAFDGTTHAIEMAWKKCQETEKPLIAGCMVHYVIEEVDKGEPLVVKELEIIPGKETLDEYEARVHATEHIAIVEATKKALDSKTN
ncbi:similar to Saccharomyces cerevisiae YDR408C ADE8 Phosphoribosyl-glycinamide transformylase, catalyzes a step in the 'de novo' purine nucleotide biosynthetic pathway [Maudiozyma saulgeensis]|uniref:Phosphoribosylglycinamide formyltransferase n=1 Tax=Maudiozyma saulgeensis TaxID=1789683 RepID=A0A1X7R284_9SACH|nr:similar to Saccharomyces cerevisiae YDR408C ADE8 Phosphoribosyl-glycinamide transformylase, catalyzes a step in the 'de novo' purine nucleotide biosynthetic pathway [Kazachstania saulgeensis]